MKAKTIVNNFKRQKTLSAGAITDLAIFRLAYNFIKLDNDLNGKEKDFTILPVEIRSEFEKHVNKVFTTLDLVVINYSEYTPRVQTKLDKIKSWADTNMIAVNLIQIAVLILLENFTPYNRKKKLEPALETIWNSISKSVFFISDVVEDYGDDETSSLSTKIAFSMLGKIR